MTAATKKSEITSYDGTTARATIHAEMDGVFQIEIECEFTVDVTQSDDGSDVRPQYWLEAERTGDVKYKYGWVNFEQDGDVTQRMHITDVDRFLARTGLDERVSDEIEDAMKDADWKDLIKEREG